MPRGPKYPDVDGMKRCIACEEVLPVSMFKPVDTPSGYHAECGPCVKARWRREYRKSEERYRSHSRNQWEAMSVESRSMYNERQRARNAANPERTAMHDRKKLMKRYGLTPDTYDELLAAQGGVCAICCGPPKGRPGVSGTSYHIDHDHTTGAVRGLLCNTCNSGLGNFKDDPERLADAIRYLQDPPAPKVHRTA